MPKIKLVTEIDAQKTICFDLSRSIELHLLSTKNTGERAIAGVTSGLIGLNETVTWRAKHFGLWQNLTSKITAFSYPDIFVDEMVNGAFKSFKHQHEFIEKDQYKTVMVDYFDYKSPLGILGKVADWLFLKQYMIVLLKERNAVIKQIAETDQWKTILPRS